MTKSVSKKSIYLVISFLLLFSNHLLARMVYQDYITYNYYNDRYFASNVFDFSQETIISKRKKLFVDFMSLIIDTENKQIEESRVKLQNLKKKKLLSNQDFDYINNIEKVYLLDISLRNEDIDWEELFKRVDMIPRELAISQSAIESGWGTSAFAKKANNMFGHWTYEVGKGIVPKRRNPGDTHEIAIFKSVNDSVRKYMLNLNTNRTYENLRDIRSQLRSRGQEVTGEKLSAGLLNYSALGEEYILMVNIIIKDVVRYWRVDDMEN